MTFPITRLRRLRSSTEMRSLVRETTVQVTDLIQPLFLIPGKGVRNAINSMPGQYQLSIDKAAEYAKKLYELGIPGVLLFAIPEHKDDTGSAAWDERGIIQQGIQAIKAACPGMLVITDLCFCEYTSHGHCGIMKDGNLQNDATLEIIVKQTLSHAKAGADVIAPSGMLDGCVRAMRQGLDESSYSHLPIMGYSAKFASAYYGPFREAVQSTPSYGDRKTYQMDPANREEALREVEQDLNEGADIIMVKPALSYLDVIREAKDRFHMPTACYNVSGEYAMVKAAAANGWIDGTKIMCETLLSMKRAGADIIITYFAEEFASLQ